MGLLGDFVKGFILYTVVMWVFAIIGFLAMGQIGIVLLIFVTLMIPISIIVFEYWKNKKEKTQTKQTD